MTESINIQGETIILDARKVIFWEERETLILSDLHLGKAGHFRKSGIPIPTSIHESDLVELSLIIDDFEPRRILFLGDLFHSDLNSEWDQFESWMAQYQYIEMILVKGNHDVLDPKVYDSSQLIIHEELQEPPFHFSHEQVDSALFNISGHVHPGIRLVGKARQGATLPCFYFQEKSALLPAFGNFTGVFKIKPAKGSQVYAIAAGELFGIKP